MALKNTLPQHRHIHEVSTSVLLPHTVPSNKETRILETDYDSKFLQQFCRCKQPSHMFNTGLLQPEAEVNQSR